jgi:CheY-like chemotaxis protein
VPDLILLDLVMPVMDGTAFLKRLREDPSKGDAPVIVCTGKELSLGDRKRLLGQAARILEKGEAFEEDLMSALADYFPIQSGGPAPPPETEPEDAEEPQGGS